MSEGGRVTRRPSPGRRPRKPRRGSKRGRTRRQKSRLDYYAFGALVVASPQLVGGALPWTVWAMAIPWAVCGLYFLWSEPRIPKLRWGFGAALLGLGLTVFQAIPLPKALVGWFSPERIQQVEPTYALLESEPEWYPLSLDPGGTQLAILIGVCVITAWALADRVATRHGRRATFQLIAGSVVLMALAAIVHTLAGADRVWGFYQPRFVRIRMLAPLLNGSHLGAFCAFGLPLCMGLAISSRQRSATVSWSAATVACGVLVPVSGSRGAVLGLVASLCIVLALFLRRPLARPKSGRSTWALVGGTMALTVAAGAYLGYDQLREGFAHGDYEKLAVAWKATIESLRFPVVGVGRGAYGAVFGVLSGSEDRFLHPENVVAQWIVEWGVVGGAAVLVGMGLALLRVLSRAKRTTTICAAAAVTGLAVHDLVDFSLEMAGVAVVAAATMGVLASRRDSNSSTTPGRRRVVRVMGVALVLTSIGLPLLAEPGQSFEATAALWDDPAIESESGDGKLRSAIAAHPLEPGLALLAGYRAVRRDQSNAPAWLNRAMVLAPSWHAPHQLAGRWLFVRGRTQQAALELREAERLRPSGGGSLACELAARSEDPSWVLAVPPEGERGGPAMERLAKCLGGHPELVATLDERLLELDPDAMGPRTRAAARAESVSERIALLREALERSDDVSVRFDLAAAFMAAGAPEEALNVLESAPRDRRTLQVLAAAQSALGDSTGLSQTLTQLRGMAGGDPQKLALVHVLEGDLAESRGERGQGLAAYERALDLQPTLERTLRVARAAEQMGLILRAEQARTQACRRFRHAPSCRPTRSRSPERIPWGPQRSP